MWDITNTPMHIQCLYCILWDYEIKLINTPYGTKQTPTSRLRINFDTICNDPHPIFGPKGALTALKCVYLVKMSFYIYNVRNILPYPMWDITNATSANGGINYPYNATAISPFVSSISSLTKQMVSERALLHFSWRTKRRILLDSPFSPLWRLKRTVLRTMCVLGEVPVWMSVRDAVINMWSIEIDTGDLHLS